MLDEAIAMENSFPTVQKAKHKISHMNQQFFSKAHIYQKRKNSKKRLKNQKMNVQHIYNMYIIYI